MVNGYVYEKDVVCDQWFFTLIAYVNDIRQIELIM
jgi:hypothetical protein